MTIISAPAVALADSGALGEAADLAAVAVPLAVVDSPVEAAALVAAEPEDVGKMTTIPLDPSRIKEAIARAEALTSGEIRVVLYPHEVDDPVATAKMEFTRLAMHRTRQRNAVLILVAPSAKAFAIFGDEGLHARCGPGFWQEVADTMVSHFRNGEFTEGVVKAIDQTGALLAQHFPYLADDENELPDDMVDRGTVI